MIEVPALASKPVNVYLTVDVECSMGGAWGNAARRPVSPERRMICRNKEGEWGVGFLAAELGRYGFRGTFFTEMFAATVFGEEALRPVVGRLLEAGQDVQLHLHPIFLRYTECWEAGDFLPARIGRIGLRCVAWRERVSCWTRARTLPVGALSQKTRLPLTGRAGSRACWRCRSRWRARTFPTRAP